MDYIAALEQALGKTAEKELLPLQPGDLTFAHVQAFVDEIVTVDDTAIASAADGVPSTRFP